MTPNALTTVPLDSLMVSQSAISVIPSVKLARIPPLYVPLVINHQNTNTSLGLTVSTNAQLEHNLIIRNLLALVACKVVHCVIAKTKPSA